jgi:hypothetical protein
MYRMVEDGYSLFCDLFQKFFMGAKFIWHHNAQWENPELIARTRGPVKESNMHDQLLLAIIVYVELCEQGRTRCVGVGLIDLVAMKVPVDGAEFR